MEHADELLHLLGGLGWHEVLDRDVDLVADPDPVASAVLDVLDRGDLNAQRLGDQLSLVNDEFRAIRRPRY